MLGVKVNSAQRYLDTDRCLIQLSLHLQLYGLLQRLIHAELLAPSRGGLFTARVPIAFS